MTSLIKLRLKRLGYVRLALLRILNAQKSLGVAFLQVIQKLQTGSFLLETALVFLVLCSFNKVIRSFFLNVFCFFYIHRNLTLMEME